MGIARTLTHQDAVVQEVLDVWTPRFLSGGIPIGDLTVTVARMRSWNDWAGEWMTTARRHEHRAEQLADDDHVESSTDAFVLASRCYHLAYFVSTRDPDLHERGLVKMLECHDRALPNLTPAVEKVEFAAGATKCVGLLSVPPGAESHPVVILLPGLDSTKETRHAGRARWIRRGVAVLSMDGPGQGEASRWSVVRPDYEVAVAAAIDWIATRADLDEAAVGLVGASLAGYYAPRAAAFERRVSAVVANCGPFDWAACWDGLPTVTREAFMHYSGSDDLDAAREVAAGFTLAGVADQIRSPLIVFHGELDPLIPWQQGERTAREGGGEFVLVESGNHGLNNLPYTWLPRSIDWMCSHLGT
ncbi:MAG: alpha/beta hydrolase [Acidimicrobiia bacterium]|nr:alpha/beta hydrolase [Acidimicrobiia bacterium]